MRTRRSVRAIVLALPRWSGHYALVLRVGTRLVPLVVVMSFALFLFVGMVLFGVNTSCTDAWSCSSSFCSPCRVVTVASFGGLLVGAALGVAALLSPWPHRRRGVIYIAAIVATALLILVVAQTWRAP